MGRCTEDLEVSEAAACQDRPRSVFATQPAQGIRTQEPHQRQTHHAVAPARPKDDIESGRIKKSMRRVFSYRAKKSQKNRLYEQERAYIAFKNTLRKKASDPSHKWVAITDIGDFYPRLYQHRLKNVIETVSKTQRNRELGRVLVDKFINLITSPTSKDSYGISGKALPRLSA
jgi:hypothetical protein